MSSSIVCKTCNSSDIEADRARGITYCTNCGNVLEESIIVSEVQIEEAAGGGCNIIGQFVSSNDTRCISIHGLQNSLRESKEITLQNGRKLINEMGSQLRLNQHCLDTAFNFYKWAVQRGLTRGRKIRQVIAACLYIVCRTERTPHMLLDLCDIVHDDACYISSLGKLAMKFAYLLCINLPEIDPGLFIPRFAQKLDFGDKTHEVSETALRLVQRMNKDWMATGRRPSGLCGAALLVSARMYDFDRSLDDIVKVVKIGKTTLRKRMLEFEDTQSSNLTVDEFRTINLDELEAHDPPAFTRSRKFAIIKQIEEMTNIQEIEKEIIQLQENIETALNELNKPRGVMAKYAKLTKFEDEILGPNKDVTNIDTEIKEAEEFLSEDQINLIKSIVNESQMPSTSSGSDMLNEDDKWNNLKPTLRSLGLVNETNNLLKAYEMEEDDLDEDDDEEDDDLFDEEDELDESIIDEYETNEDEEDENPLDLMSIRKRRKKLRNRLRQMKKARVEVEIRSSEQIDTVHIEENDSNVQVLNVENETIPSTSLSSINKEIHNENITKELESNINNQTNESEIEISQSENPTEISTKNSDELDLEGIDDGEIDSVSELVLY
jgi:transcription factor IIIB subunit 2